MDYFRFAAKRGQVFDVRVLARALRSPLDSVLTVLRSGGGVVASNDDANGPDSYLRFTAPADDDYIIQVTDQLHAGGPTYVYRIEVTPVEPQLALGLPEREAFVDVTVPVPRGEPHGGAGERRARGVRRQSRSGVQEPSAGREGRDRGHCRGRRSRGRAVHARRLMRRWVDRWST